MSKENDLIDRIAKAGRTQQEREALSEAFAKTRAQYIAAWEKSEPDDAAGRERVWLAMQIIARVEDNLKSMANDGKIAERELEALRKIGRAA